MGLRQGVTSTSNHNQHRCLWYGDTANLLTFYLLVYLYLVSDFYKGTVTLSHLTKSLYTRYSVSLKVQKFPLLNDPFKENHINVHTYRQFSSVYFGFVSFGLNKIRKIQHRLYYGKNTWGPDSGTQEYPRSRSCVRLSECLVWKHTVSEETRTDVVPSPVQHPFGNHCKVGLDHRHYEDNKL